MTTKYEVQYVDGLGAWRRWALCSTVEAALASIKRLDAFGIKSGRVVTVTR